MLLDARRLPDDLHVEADVCVIGTGPAGSVIATELAAAGLRVAMLESGGEDYSADAQSLANGSTSGHETPPLCQSRHRRLGGTSHLWNNGLGGGTTGFRCGMLSAIDFEERPWIPHSGWPISFDDLKPHIARAKAACGLGDCTFDGAEWDSDRHPVLGIPASTAGTSLWHYAPQEIFTREFPAKLRDSQRITAYLHADAMEITTNEAGSAATGVIARTLARNEVTVRARSVILAAGGIENARLLLLSRSRHANGIGNRHDLVGRFFMEHPVFHAGTFIPKSREMMRKLGLYDLVTADNSAVTGKLNLSEDVLRREKLLNSGMFLLPRHRWFRPDGGLALRQLLGAGQGHSRTELLRRIWRGSPYIAIAAARRLTGNRNLLPFVTDGPPLTQPGWSQSGDIDDKYQVVDCFLISEQAPNPENRLTLSSNRDPLGRQRMNLHWELRQPEIASVLKTQEIYVEAFRRSGIGRFLPEREAGRPKLFWPGLHHHAGTTRMASTAQDGVVNADCRIHDVAGLFVAGCSVFPTAGYINPTLPIIAMSFRLADHVSRLLSSRPPAVATAGHGAEQEVPGRG
jgi:choline dehydrogenase-like flavoprotein